MKIAAILLMAVAVYPQAPPKTPARVAVSLLDVKRIYVAPLAGGSAAEPMREMIIASLNSTGLFILTEDENRADAIVKGAADDTSYVDTFDSDRSVSGHTSGGLRSSGSTSLSSSGAYGGLGGGDREAYHIKERKHEAYATLRLVNHAGDTLWSTTQESQGAKFRAASTDVGAKVARQITLDVSRAQRLAPDRSDLRP